MKWFFVFLLFLSLLFSPRLEAQIVITEIMYDPKESDASSGGEWIEVQNTSVLPIDLSTWIFFEADTNHGITADGTPNLPAGGYAVISRDLTAFKNYFNSFSAPLFKASFSLNDGEKLAMKSGKDAVVGDSVTYSSETGAKNDGNSLQRSGEVWVARTPTPGEATGGTSSSENSGTVNNPAENSTSSTNGSGVTKGKVEQQIFPYAGEDFVGMAGATLQFEGSALGVSKEPLINARYIWNFGDGVSKEAKTVAHIYHFPGEYLVTLDVSSGEYANSDGLKVLVIPPAISISDVKPGMEGYVELYNESEYDLDISSWQIIQGNIIFSLPAHTKILHKKKVRIANQVSSLVGVGEIVLRFPNGSSLAKALMATSSFPKDASLVAAPSQNSKIVASQERTQSTPPPPSLVKPATLQAAVGEVTEAVEESGVEKLGPLTLWGGVASLITVGAAGGLWWWRRARDKRMVIEGFDIIEE